jgi:hypothetical protein
MTALRCSPLLRDHEREALIGDEEVVGLFKEALFTTYSEERLEGFLQRREEDLIETVPPQHLVSPQPACHASAPPPRPLRRNAGAGSFIPQCTGTVGSRVSPASEQGYTPHTLPAQDCHGQRRRATCSMRAAQNTCAQGGPGVSYAQL